MIVAEAVSSRTVVVKLNSDWSEERVKFEMFPTKTTAEPQIVGASVPTGLMLSVTCMYA